MNRFIYFGALFFAVVGGLFAFRPNPLLQLLLALGLLAVLAAFITSVVNVFVSWNDSRWRTLFPIVTIVFTPALCLMTGEAVRDAYFHHKIPELQRAVDHFRSAGEMPEVNWLGLGDPIAVRSDSEEVVVAFAWGGGFPVKHTALIYCSSDQPMEYFRESGWKHGYALQDQWWVVGN